MAVRKRKIRQWNFLKVVSGVCVCFVYAGCESVTATVPLFGGSTPLSTQGGTGTTRTPTATTPIAKPNKGPPVITFATLSPSGLTLFGQELQNVSDIQLLDPNSTVVATFTNIRTPLSGSTLTASAIAAHAAPTLSLAAGVLYRLLVTNANASSYSNIIIGTIGAPVNISGGYLNAIGIGNAALPSNTSPGKQGILFTDSLGYPWIGADTAGNLFLQTGGTQSSPIGILTLAPSGTVGIGISNPGIHQLHVQAATTGVQSAIIADGTLAYSGPQYGIVSTPTLTGVSGGNFVAGFYSAPTFSAASSGPITTAAAFATSPSFTGTGTITTAMGLYVSAGGTTPGTITKSYGLYVENPQSGTSKYAGYFGGNVGVGVTAPVAPLQVNGTLMASRTTQSSQLEFSLYTGANDRFVIYQPANSNETRFFLADTTLGALDVMTLKPGGNVGIGTTVPLNTLQIGAQSAYLTSTPITLSLGGTYSSTPGQYPKLKLYDDGTLTYGLGVSSAAMEFQVPTGAGFTFHINSSEKVRIQNDGRVGIGTASPNYPLEVVAGVCASTSATGSYFGVPSLNSGNYATNAGWTRCTTVKASGAIVSGDGFFAASDCRLKTDIQDLNDDAAAVKFIEGIRPVHFKWKEGGTPTYGFIAQDILKLGFPEMVTTTLDQNNKLLKETTDEDGFVSAAGVKMAVDHNQITALLSQSVKYLYKKFSAEDQELQALREMNRTLQQENTKIKTYLCRKDHHADFCK